MALVSMRQLLDHAAEHGYGLPAFNVNNLEQVKAIMEAADETNSPVIMQGSAGARKYAGEAFLRHLIEAAIETYPHIPVVHAPGPRRLAGGVHQRDPQSGFSSVMMDGSLKEDAKTPASFDYNVDVTRRVVEMSHAVGVSVEGELGCLGSLETGMGEKEDGHGAEGVLTHDQLLTDPERGGGIRQADRGRCAGDRDRHLARRVQVHQAAHRRNAGDQPHQGDPCAHSQHPPGDARLVVGAAGMAEDHQRIRRRHGPDLRRAG